MSPEPRLCGLTPTRSKYVCPGSTAQTAALVCSRGGVVCSMIVSVRLLIPFLPLTGAQRAEGVKSRNIRAHTVAVTRLDQPFAERLVSLTLCLCGFLAALLPRHPARPGVQTARLLRAAVSILTRVQLSGFQAAMRPHRPPH